MEPLKEKLKSYRKEDIVKLRELLLKDEGLAWGNVMNNLYNSSQQSIQDLYNSDVFLSFSNLFTDTTDIVYLNEMTKLLEELEQRVEDSLEKIDQLYLHSVGYVEFLLEVEPDLEEIVQQIHTKDLN